MTPIRRLGWTALALLALVGCDTPMKPDVPPPATPGTGTTAGSATGGTAGTGVETPARPSNETKALPVEPGKPGASVDKLSDEELAEIKKLPADDQAIALAQKICPVSKDHLGEGGMGVPIKQAIGDRTFFICCSGCEKKVKNDPAGVLAELDKLKK